ncbi:glycoside hydrolase family 18 protein [Xylona heveae TC161]|uniref:chitinase n=1 Tax=Xylona heveae (strain CBS 132557 / TC161) TaxID=1328760 RepID=A0A165JB63_XYLHT|nr:glycoside hydrolase family 18 protein [Xylona heveae TC161]KZF25999.1 glycoside hydrolase family 18 protein [Xylona heveae TC161]
MSATFGPNISLVNRWTQSTRNPRARSSVPHGGGSPLVMYKNGVYYPNWRVHHDQPPSSLMLDAISHVFYASAWVKTDGTVFLSDEWADSGIEVDGQLGCLRAFASLKRKHSQLKLILSIGGGNQGSDGFAQAASSPSGRAQFATSARTLINQFGFDGIDVDWEYPSSVEEGNDYILLLATIRSFLPSGQYILTSALSAGEWALKHIDLVAAAGYVDLINLMAYDFYGPWTDKAGHQAQLYAPKNLPPADPANMSCQSAVNYMLSRDVPANKILLGIPTYGRSFKGAEGVGQSHSGQEGDSGTFEYKDLPGPGAREAVDEELGAAFAIGGPGGFVSYDNPTTVKMKANFVKQTGLAGLFYWPGTSDVRGPRSLIQTGFTTLHQFD